MFFCAIAKKLKPQAMRPLSSFRRDRTDSSPHRVLFPLNWAMEIVELPDLGSFQGTGAARKLFERQSKSERFAMEEREDGARLPRQEAQKQNGFQATGDARKILRGFQVRAFRNG